MSFIASREWGGALAADSWTAEALRRDTLAESMCDRHGQDELYPS